MRQFQIHLAFSAYAEKDALALSKAVETMVSVFCLRNQWSLHMEEEGQPYASSPSSVSALALA